MHEFSVSPVFAEALYGLPAIKFGFSGLTH